MAGAPIRIYRVNTGSCGGCDLMIDAAAAAPGIAWADDPYSAEVVLLTGPVTAALRPALRALLRSLQGRVPVVALGRCAIDGHPFGRGGVAELADVDVQLRLEGCPPTAAQIGEALRALLRDGAA